MGLRSEISFVQIISLSALFKSKSSTTPQNIFSFSEIYFISVRFSTKSMLDCQGVVHM